MITQQVSVTSQALSKIHRASSLGLENSELMGNAINEMNDEMFILKVPLQ